jgi:hypothetical protein
MYGETKSKTFSDDLMYSTSQADDPLWQALYRKAFPGFESMQLITDIHEQKRGRDRVIRLTSGHTYYVEEKKRRKSWGDILLEYISVDSKNIPGWICKDLDIDYLAYAFMDNRIAYLFPWPILKRAWKHYGTSWIEQANAHKDGFDIVIADNMTYKTHSVAVPIKTLLRTMRSGMIITF